MFPIGSPFPQFSDSDGDPLEDGQIFFGVANQNPETNPIIVYWDEAGTQPAAQPIRTIGGFSVRAGTPANLFVNSDYSIVVKHRSGALIAHSASAYTAPLFLALASLGSPTGGSSVGFIQSGTGAVARTTLDKERDIVCIFDWLSQTKIANIRAGQSVDVTAELQYLLTWLGTQDIYPNGFSIYVPRGYYALSASVTIPENLTQFNMHGDGMFSTHFMISAGVDAFIGVAAHSVVNSLHWENIGFFGGSRVTFFGTRNVDRSMWHFDHCQFKDQTTTSIDMFASPNASSLTAIASHCLFWGAQKMVNATCDYFRVIDCWVETNTTGPVFSSAQTFDLIRMTGVPIGGYGATACWVESSGHCNLLQNRFGSEDGHGRTMLHQLAANNSSVRVHDNFAPVLDDYIYKFDAAPTNLSILRNTDYGGLGAGTSKGFWFKDATTAADIAAGNWTVDDFSQPALGYFYYDGTGSKPMQELARARIAQNTKRGLTQNVIYADALLSIDSATRPLDSSSTNITVGTGAYPLLGGFTAKKLTCTANHGSYLGINDLIAGSTGVGMHTFVFDCYVTGADTPFQFVGNFQGNVIRQTIDNGINIIVCYGQQQASLTNDQFNFSAIPNGAVILLGRERIFLGLKDIRTVETIYTDKTAGTIPNAALISHNKGDRILFTDAASGAAPGMQCTTAGQPGTFKNFAALA